MGKLKFYKRRGSGGKYYEGRTRRKNERIDEADVVDYLKKGAWTEWGSTERPKITDDGSEDEDDVPLLQYMTGKVDSCLLYTSPSPRDLSTSRMPSSA